MGKLGDLLNKDVGSIATKILKADVGDIVKGAGRALNTDVGTIAKGAGNVLTYDLGDLFSSGSKTDSAPSTGTIPPGPSQSPEAGTQMTPSAKAGAPSEVVANSQTATDPATNDATGTTANPPQRAKLTDALVARSTRKMPDGSNLTTLLPARVGPFSRPADAVHGDIASDAVSATYSNDTDAVTVTIAACWDADEARDKQQRRQLQLENARSAPDHSWSIGANQQGVVFIWTREHYCYEIISPRGVSALARFLTDFPY